MTPTELVDCCEALMDRRRRGEHDEAVKAAIATAKAAKRELAGQFTSKQKGLIRGILADARRVARRARNGRRNQQ